MYGIFTYIQLMFMVNVGKYTIHGADWYFFIRSDFLRIGIPCMVYLPTFTINLSQM